MAPRITTPDAATRRVAALTGSQRVHLGITGLPGVGKSTLAQRLVAKIPGAVLVPMDGFHLAQAVLDATGLAERKGAPETFDRQGFAWLLTRIREQHRNDPPIYAPLFRRDIEEPIAGAVTVASDCPLVVTEGNYLLHWPEVRDLLDEVWWVEIDRDERLRRLTARHEAYGKSPESAAAWARGSDERNASLIEGDRELADVVVAGD